MHPLDWWRARQEPDRTFLLTLFVLEEQVNTPVTGLQEREVHVDGIADDFGDGPLAHLGLEAFKFFGRGDREPEGEAFSVLVEGFSRAHRAGVSV